MFPTRFVPESPTFLKNPLKQILGMTLFSYKASKMGNGISDDSVKCEEHSDCQLSQSCLTGYCGETCPDSGCTEKGGICVDIRRANLTDSTVFPLNTVNLETKIGDSTLCNSNSPKACCECYESGEADTVKKFLH